MDTPNLSPVFYGVVYTDHMRIIAHQIVRCDNGQYLAAEWASEEADRLGRQGHDERLYWRVWEGTEGVAFEDLARWRGYLVGPPSWLQAHMPHVAAAAVMAVVFYGGYVIF